MKRLVLIVMASLALASFGVACKKDEKKAPKGDTSGSKVVDKDKATPTAPTPAPADDKAAAAADDKAAAPADDKADPAAKDDTKAGGDDGDEEGAGGDEKDDEKDEEAADDSDDEKE